MTSAEEIVIVMGLIAAPLCAAALNLNPSRRASLLLLLGVFAGTAGSVSFDQELRIGLGLFATGAVACAVLAVGFERSRWPTRSARGGPLPGGRGFRAATILLVGVAVWGLTIPYASTNAPTSAARLTSAAMILAMGLLQLGLSQEQGAAALGLLTTLAGFEFFYTALEPSLALRASLGGIMVAIALISSILLEVPSGVEGRRVE
jgi:hypothetical protein